MTPTPPKKKVMRDLHGSVRMKVGLIVGGTMLLVMWAAMYFSAELMVTLFGAQQDRLTQEKLERVVICFNKLGELKMRQVRDNAQWDDAYYYIQGSNPYFLSANFSADVNTSGQDIVMVFDGDKNLLGKVDARAKAAGVSAESLDLATVVNSTLFQDGPRAGLFSTGDEVIYMAACPINTSDVNAESNGWLVFGTCLDQGRTGEIEELSGARLKISPLEKVASLKNTRSLRKVAIEGSMPAEGVFQHAASFKQPRSDARTLLILPTLGNASVGVEVWVSMLVYTLALEARSWIIVVACVVAVILLGVGLLAFEFSILQPLASLDREMRKISSAENPEAFLKIRSGNEIGRLAQSANRLLQRVRAGRHDAEEQKELLSSVLNSATEGVVAFLIKRGDEGEVEDFVYVLVNASAEKMLSRKAENLIGRGLLQEYPSLKDLGVFDRYCRVVATNQTEIFESYYNAEGIDAWLNISATPWKEGLVITFENITERKIKEEQLQGTLQEIERFNAAMIGREERILEMKKEVNALRARLGLTAVYNSTTTDA